MRSLGAWIGRVVDIRRGEAPAVVRASVSLFLIVGAQAALETARDVLLLSRMPPQQLAVIYLAVALVALPVAALVARAVQRLGLRRTLVGALATSSLVLVAVFLSPVGPVSLVALYVASSLLPAVLIPLFWNLVGVAFVGQARRLIGVFSAAGLVGALAGATIALAVDLSPIKPLLLVAALSLIAAAGLLPGSEAAQVAPAEANDGEISRRPVWNEPFVVRIALLVGFATAASVLLDYLFKWTVARTVAPQAIPVFVARYYVVLNVATLVVQLIIGRLVVRHRGALAAMVLTPLVLVAGGVVTLACGGTLGAVLTLKGVDTVVRGAFLRAGTELLYLPLSVQARVRARPLIDGALMRATQAVVGTTLLVLALQGQMSAVALGAIIVLIGATWLLVVWRTRGPYLALLRRSVGGSASAPWVSTDPLDLETAGALVEHLSHADPAEVLGAMNALARRDRHRLVPALILLHEDESVLVRALSLLSHTKRVDWFSRARKLLGDGRAPVRLAAARALALHAQLDPAGLDQQTSPDVRQYSTLRAALGRDDVDLVHHPVIVEILNRPDPDGQVDRVELAAAIADAPVNPQSRSLLAKLCALPGAPPAWNAAIARAIAAQRATDQIPFLISLLGSRHGRDVVEAALVSFGDEAVEALRGKIAEPATPRAVRTHIPAALAQIGGRTVVEGLLEIIEGDRDGLVRYRAVRALGRLVAERRLKVDRLRLERLALANVAEYFRLLALRCGVAAAGRDVGDPGEGAQWTKRLLLGLLDDKLRQAMARVFRLLKIAHADEDLHRLHDAYLSDDRAARANAAEVIGALLDRRDQGRLRQLLRILGEEPTEEEALERALPLLPARLPRPGEALELLAGDRDAMLAGLARLQVAAMSTSAGGAPGGSKPPPGGLKGLGYPALAEAI